jgi:UDP-glucuronate 4-epimerase
LIEVLRETTGIQPQIHRLAEQPGDVLQTFADIRKARALLGYEPTMDFAAGILEFWCWLNDSSHVV